MGKIVLKEDSYKVIGLCMEVHRRLGKGFLEIVYKDALEYEFQRHRIHFEREKMYEIAYRDIILRHRFYADFVVLNDIILEIKGCSGIAEEFLAQTLNYLAVSGCKLGLVVNFGNDSLEYRRVVL